MTSFNDLKISEPVMSALGSMGFEEATPIQEQAIPVIMEGRDIIGQAQTGTGKTAAFGIPVVEKCDTEGGHIQAMVIAPTRELAIQVAEELNRIGQTKGIRSLPIYGGQNIKWQMNGLKNKPHIIVGTPGRLVDHILRRKTISLDHIKIVVLDEADEMLDMGFIEDIETLLKETPAGRQTLLFSATMPAQVRGLAQKFMRDPLNIGITSKKVSVPPIVQNYVEVHEKQKFDVLCRLLDIQSPDLAIVFGRTKKRVNEIYEGLTKRGYSARELHGDMDQSRRDSVMRQFRDGSIQVLVATDVAARGLDISGVTHVYNFDIPQDPESYVHRIGRTGRAGKSGLAITFASPKESRLLKIIEQVSGQRMTRLAVPTLDEAMEGQQRLTVEKLVRVMEEENISKYIPMAEMLLENNDSVTIISAALKMLTKEPDMTPINLTEIKPARMRNVKHPKRVAGEETFREENLWRSIRKDQYRKGEKKSHENSSDRAYEKGKKDGSVSGKDKQGTPFKKFHKSVSDGYRGNKPYDNAKSHKPAKK